MKRCKYVFLAGCLALAALTGCAKEEASEQTPMAEAAQTEAVSMEEIQQMYVDAVELEVKEEIPEEIILEEPPAPPIPDILEPVASGEKVEANDKVQIDYSHTDDGYIMVLYTEDTYKKLKVQIKGPTTTYTYNLYPAEWVVYPLTDGNGSYQFKVYQNVSGSQYSLVMALSEDVSLSDEFAPFLRPNQYVNYAASSKAVEKGLELTQGLETTLEKVEAIYNFVVTELKYDDHKAATVKSGYLPVLDTVLEEKKGICFDYASLMTGMLRSQGIPCKMIFGYAGSAYHAWISVWTEDSGWVDGVIFFDGIAWKRLDPTFASTSEQSQSIMDFIGNGKNYREKYFY